MILDLTVVAVEPVELTLATPHRAAHGDTRARVGVRLELGAGALRGRGEAWPLPGYSRDDVDGCRVALERIGPRSIALDEHFIAHLGGLIEGIDEPAARFAVETAVLDLAGHALGRPAHRLLRATSPRPVPLSALVHDVAGADRAAARGITTVKLKIAVRTWADELAQIAAIRAAHPRLAIRVDANRGLDPARAAAQLGELAALGVGLIEEPVPVAQLAALGRSPVPVALDESLAELDRDEVRALLAAGRVSALVLKPTLLGGALRCLELASLAAPFGAHMIVSHCLEGGVARAATCELALALGATAACGLDADPAELDVAQLRRCDVAPARGPGIGCVEPASLSALSAARDAPDRLALIAGGRTMTYAALATRVRAEMRALRHAGARHAIAVVAHRNADTIVRALAAFELDLRVALLHPRASGAEHADQRRRIEDAGPSLAGAGIVVFTSGSTGAPRGVVLDRAALSASARASAANLGWRDDDRWLVALPLAHVGGLAIVIRTVLARRCAVLDDDKSFDPARVIEAIDNGATLVSLVPAMLARLLREHPGWKPPAHLRAVLLGGAATHAGALAEAIARGLPVLPTYGMSEAGSQLCTPRPGEPAVGCGAPLPGVELVAGTDQRLRVRGPMVMRGYLDGASGVDADGWFTTSDRGRFDEGGNLHVLGRVDDTIVTGGENVDPHEVEEALLALPGVLGACVLGVADDTFGHIVAAVIASDDAATEVDSRARAIPLASFKRPRLVRVVDRLPLGPTGKVDRAACRVFLDPA